MKAIKFLVVAAFFAATSASVRAQTVAPSPTPAPGIVPGGGNPMPPATMDSGAMMGGNYGGPVYGPSDAGGYGDGGYCGNGYCGDCGNGHCGGCGLFGGHGGYWNGGLFSHCGRSYLSIDAVMLNRGTGFQQSLVTSGVGGPTVLDSEDPWFGHETLPRITGGYVLPNDTAVEASYFYKDDMNASDGLTSPINNLVIPTVGAFASAQVNFSTQIQNFELNLVETGRVFNFLAGFRYIELQDHMRLNASTLLGTTFNTSIDTYNSLFGAQAGFRGGYDIGLFHLEGTGKAGMFYNHGNGHTNATTIPGGAVYSQRDTGGDTESFVGELNCSLSYRPTAALAFRAGYQIYWIVNTGLAQAQYNPVSPLSSGQSYNDRGDLILHGPSAGVDLRW